MEKAKTFFMQFILKRICGHYSCFIHDEIVGIFRVKVRDLCLFFFLTFSRLLISSKDYIAFYHGHTTNDVMWYDGLVFNVSKKRSIRSAIICTCPQWSLFWKVKKWWIQMSKVWATCFLTIVLRISWQAWLD